MAFASTSPDSAVSDVQGLDGTFQFPERLLQKLWQRRDWDDREARLEDGRSLRVEHPGRWNRLGGPDFRDAILLLGGERIVGDVEVHLHAADWRAHGHALDRAYDRVVLHVVLFPPGVVWTRGAGDGRIPLLCLLPRLPRGLEDLAAEDLLERWADPGTVRCEDGLLALGESARWAAVRGAAAERWRRKCAAVRRRVDALGWEDACHHSALEVLGYRFNRVPMLRVATAWPLSAWRAGGLDLRGILEQEAGRWCRQGIRPANQPRRRLEQYAAWVAAVPDWPQRLARVPWPEVAEPGDESPEKVRRRRELLAGLRRSVLQPLTGNRLAGPRLDTLICDALLPLATVLRADASCARLWWHWFPGDLPDRLRRALGALGLVGPGHPRTHGVAQGVLGWRLAREEEERRRTPSNDPPTGRGERGLTTETAGG